jgi:thiol-disulfide isomerase/thioredoxin
VNRARGGILRYIRAAVVVAFFIVAAGGAAASPASQLSGEIDAKELRRVVSRQNARLVLVNFWATWCVPCREEFPDLVRLQKNLGPKGLRIIGVSTDVSKELPKVKAFLKQQRPGFPNYHKKAGGDDQEFINTVDALWGGELPFSVIYDGSGKKIKTLSGKHSYADYEKEVLASMK